MEEEAERIAQQYGNERINASTMPLTKRADIETFFPFPPAKGVIVNNYSVANKHFGIDIRNKKNSLIYSIDKGIVIFQDMMSKMGILSLSNMKGILFQNISITID